MKITKGRLKEIIEEEVAGPELDDVARGAIPRRPWRHIDAKDAEFHRPVPEDGLRHVGREHAAARRHAHLPLPPLRHVVHGAELHIDGEARAHQHTHLLELEPTQPRAPQAHALGPPCRHPHTPQAARGDGRVQW